MKKAIRYYFFRYVWRLNYYKGINRLSMKNYMWEYRISIKTAWALSYVIIENK